MLVHQAADSSGCSADLSFSLPASDELLKLKTLMLTKRRMEPIMSFTFSNNQDLPRQLLDWCRIATINKQEAAFAMKNPDAEVSVLVYPRISSFTDTSYRSCRRATNRHR